MHKALVFVLLCLITATAAAKTPVSELDRTGTMFVAPKLGFTFPVGALADANYSRYASSWRKEGITLTAEIGYYFTKSSIGGLEMSYSNFHPKSVSIFSAEGVDKSRVRIRRIGIYLQYFIVAAGKYRPYMKLGAGLFEASRISLPQASAGAIEYKDYSLGAKPVFSVGAGIHAAFSENLSFSFSVEAVSLNSFSSSWETSGATLGPLRSNMLFFPVYFGILYHLTEN